MESMGLCLEHISEVVLLFQLIQKVSLPVVGMTSITASGTVLCLKAMKGPPTCTKKNVSWGSWDTCTSHLSRHGYKADHRPVRRLQPLLSPILEAPTLTVTDPGAETRDSEATKLEDCECSGIIGIKRITDHC